MESAGALIDMISQQYIIEDKIYIGGGYNYGMELMLRKNRGRLTGWIGYALGWAYRHTAQINDGKPYPAKQDRRHDLSIVANYRINRRWDCSAVFVYATGNALTMPESVASLSEKMPFANMDRITAGACRLITDSIYRRITGFPKRRTPSKL